MLEHSQVSEDSEERSKEILNYIKQTEFYKSHEVELLGILIFTSTLNN